MATIPYNVFSSRVEGTGIMTVDYFNKFVAKFPTQLPDERGLTDFFLVNLLDSIQKGYPTTPGHGVDFQVTRLSQNQEGQLGYDYEWSFTASNQSGKVSKYSILLQAKNFKDGVANFMYKSKTGPYQMDILKNEFDNRKGVNDGHNVQAGYILYGPKYVQYVSLDVVMSWRTAPANKVAISDAELDRKLSKNITDHGPEYYLTTVL